VTELRPLRHRRAGERRAGRTSLVGFDVEAPEGWVDFGDLDLDGELHAALQASYGEGVPFETTGEATFLDLVEHFARAWPPGAQLTVAEALTRLGDARRDSAFSEAEHDWGAKGPELRAFDQRWSPLGSHAASQRACTAWSACLDELRAAACERAHPASQLCFLRYTIHHIWRQPRVEPRHLGNFFRGAYRTLLALGFDAEDLLARHALLVAGQVGWGGWAREASA
jgi:hypothetical protein